MHVGQALEKGGQGHSVKGVQAFQQRKWPLFLQAVSRLLEKNPAFVELNFGKSS